jgi:hypothetical protein
MRNYPTKFHHSEAEPLSLKAFLRRALIILVIVISIVIAIARISAAAENYFSKPQTTSQTEGVSLPFVLSVHQLSAS